MISSLTGLQITSFMFVVIGMMLNFTALATPSWQVVYARELQQWIKNGLWMTCQTRPSGMLSCTYAFSKRDIEIYSNPDMLNIRSPAFYDWQHNLLYTVLLGQFLSLIAMIAFCLSQAAPLRLKAMIIFSLAITLSALLNICSNIAFQFYAHMVEYRFYHVSVSGIYEKHLGFSYYLHLFGSLFLIVGLCCSIIFVVLMYRRGDALPNRDYFQSYQMRYTDPEENFFAMRALPAIPHK